MNASFSTQWLELHIQPGARQTAFVGYHAGAIKIKLAALPQEGQANRALIKFLAHRFEVPLAQVELRAGASGRHKRVLIRNSSLKAAQVFPGLEFDASRAHQPTAASSADASRVRQLVVAGAIST